MTSIHQFNQEQLKKDLPEIRPGYTVVVHQKIKEGEKERTQKYEGIVISRRGGQGLSATITVRKVSEGVGVEKIFPIHSPNISKIEVLKKIKVKRAKLYHLKGYKKKIKELAV